MLPHSSRIIRQNVFVSKLEAIVKVFTKFCLVKDPIWSFNRKFQLVIWMVKWYLFKENQWHTKLGQVKMAKGDHSTNWKEEVFLSARDYKLDDTEKDYTHTTFVS